jgi:hypothetical protein
MSHQSFRCVLFVAGIAIAGSVSASGATLKDIAFLAGDMPSSIAHTEPSIAVNPLNPQQIAVVAFSGNWGASTNAPVWKSDDGGNTWRRVPQLPQPVSGQSGPNDQKIAFDRNGTLYVAELAVDSLNNVFDYIYRQNGAPDAVMAVGAVFGDDQPHLDIDKTFGSGCLDRLYSPWLNTALGNAQSHVETSTNFGVAVADAAVGDNSSFPNRTTRIALAPDGKAYVVYKTREGSAGADFENVHFNVKRSDDCGATWNALGATGSSISGATQIQSYFTNSFGAGTTTSRARSSDAWIAVDPATGDVYVSYVSKDASGFAQIYIARSSNQGTSWTSTRVTDGTHNSAFPEVAVTHHGTIGVLYIDYDTSGGTTTYRHRFARSNNLGSSWSDQILQSMNPTGFPNLNNGFIWGDYEGLTAVGSTFYGVFTGQSIGRPTPQLDPIFFREDELPNAEDFYVRDWTTSSAVHDNGAEPSTDPFFFVSSDVWNRRSNTTGTIAGGVPPDQENPQTAGLGNNFAFARITRNTSGMAKTVNVHFLYADYGLGSNFTAAAVTPDPTVAFAAGDTQLVSSGYQWDLPAVHSPHVCMAVEISTNTDPVVLPHLDTTAPGPGDPLVINDNNKAQRNMGVYPALGDSSYYAIVHNPGLKTDTIHLRFDQVRQIPTPRQISVRVIAPERPNDRSERITIKAGNPLILADMRPGENRWLEITATAPASSARVGVFVQQMANGRAVNGFGLGLRPASAAEMIRANTDFERQLFYRIEALRLPAPDGSIPDDLAKLRPEGLAPTQYREYVVRTLDRIEPILRTALARSGDPLNLRVALEDVGSALRTTSTNRVAAAHASYLHRLDAALTMIQKARGDPADIPQTVRFQRELFATALADRPRAKEIVEQSRKFLAALGAQPIRAADYVEFIKATLPDLGVASDDLAALQRSHIEYLRKLEGPML